MNGYPFKCIIVVPCYNEAERLNRVVFKSYLSRPDSASVIFVNDGSVDETLSVLQRIVEEMPKKAYILNLQKNSGKAEAVRQGVLHALNHHDATYVGFWDADLSTPLDAVADLLDVLERSDSIDIVLGSRVKLMGRDIQRKPARHYFGRLFATAASSVLGLPVYDTQCGAKLFRSTPALNLVFEKPFLSKWIFDVEILARFLQLFPNNSTIAQKIYEFPLHRWNDVPGSKLRTYDFYRAMWELWLIRRTHFSKRS